MELVRGAMFCNGLSCKEVGAHEAEISYLIELGFSKDDAMFINQLRYFRNQMVYYGKILDEQYAEKVVDFLDRFYDKLKKMVDNKLRRKNG